MPQLPVNLPVYRLEYFHVMNVIECTPNINLHAHPCTSKRNSYLKLEQKGNNTWYLTWESLLCGTQRQLFLLWIKYIPSKTWRLLCSFVSNRLPLLIMLHICCITVEPSSTRPDHVSLLCIENLSRCGQFFGWEFLHVIGCSINGTGRSLKVWFRRRQRLSHFYRSWDKIISLTCVEHHRRDIRLSGSRRWLLAGPRRQVGSFEHIMCMSDRERILGSSFWFQPCLACGWITTSPAVTDVTNTSNGGRKWAH